MPGPPMTRRAAKRKGSGKGKTTGKGKGGGKDGGKDFKNVRTPDGNPICFKHNQGRCNDTKCGRVHCCQICLGQHPACECKAVQ